MRRRNKENSMKNSPKPPNDLSLEAKKGWKATRADYGIIDDTGLTYLTTGWRFFDRLREAQETIRKEGATVTDRCGQVRAHPAITIERDAAASMIRAFKALNLDVLPNFDKPGRPPGK
jgi:P27 family predicted phage terminase small subunit